MPNATGSKLFRRGPSREPAIAERWPKPIWLIAAAVARPFRPVERRPRMALLRGRRSESFDLVAGILAAVMTLGPLAIAPWEAAG